MSQQLCISCVTSSASVKYCGHRKGKRSGWVSSLQPWVELTVIQHSHGSSAPPTHQTLATSIFSINSLLLWSLVLTQPGCVVGLLIFSDRIISIAHVVDFAFKIAHLKLDWTEHEETDCGEQACANWGWPGWDLIGLSISNHYVPNAAWVRAAEFVSKVYSWLLIKWHVYKGMWNRW